MKLTPALAALMLAAAMAFAACGDDDDDEGGSGGGDQAEAPAGPGSLAISAAADGKLQVDGTTEPGVTEVTLTVADGKKAGVAQLVRIEGDHTFKEVKKIYNVAGEGKPVPDWFRAAGGPGRTAAGQSSSVTVDLEEGTYYAVNDEEEPIFSSPFDVSGEAGDAELPETDASVTAKEYSFEPSGLTAGDNQITFENTGEQWHHVLALPINPGSTFEDAERYLKTEKGEPPVNFDEGAFSSVVEGGQTMVIDVALKKGDYALICFISDRAGGKTHFEKGMISEATVE